MQAAAVRRQQPLRKELARFQLPLGRQWGTGSTPVNEIIRAHYKAYKGYAGDDAQKALDHAFDAIRLANERSTALNSVAFMGREADGACYNVGQICRHKKYNYRFVIFGYHKSCRMPEDWVSGT